MIVFMLIAMSSAAQDARSTLSEQAVEAVKLRGQVERWEMVADRSMRT